MRHMFPILAVLAAVSCTSHRSPITEAVTTTMESPWQKGVIQPEGQAPTIIDIDPGKTDQTIQGFGVSFSELGWQSLSILSDEDRSAVLDELFVPGQGANFSICRTPVGANDFSIDFYSFDETDGDFELNDFSIERDRKTLIPLIKEALSRNPGLKIWASPWCPPTWMKYNHHYAMRPDPRVNDLTEDRRGYEGQDMFIQEDRYFDAYARYFGKYVDAYKAEGVDISMVMPQNEPNSDQNFPSCCWTAAGLTRFVQKLGPEMDKRGVDVYFGTWERPGAAAVDSVMSDPVAGKYVKGLAFQWAGRAALPTAREHWPEATLVMSEQECGNGRNDWSGAAHSWELMKHYLGNGVSIYDYWNISLIKDGLSHWGWRQNSLVVVDEDKRTCEFSIEYYLLKHVSHYVQPGAKRIILDYDNALAFANPDGSVIFVTSNETDEPVDITLSIHSALQSVRLAPKSFSTFVLR